MGSYLAINKTGQSIGVYKEWSDVKLGTIFPNERYTYMTTMIEESGGGEVYIKFRNASGQYIDGMCYIGSNDMLTKFSRPWSDFKFGTITIAGNTGYTLNTDKNVAIYSTSGSYIMTLNAGSKVYTDKQSTAGASHPDWLFLYGYNRYGYPETQSCFVNTGVASNSTNTPVYGNW
jgi:hypothetical protein